jgi:type I restriction enzyme S subunit
MLKAGYPNRDEANTQIRKQNTQVLPDGLEPRAAGWAWATLIQAGLLVADCHNKTAPYVDSGVRLLRTTNIRNGKLNLDQPKFITPATYKRWSARCKPEPGDILITREAPMGEVCIIPEGMKICLGQRMMMVRLVPGTMDPKFLLYSLMDPALMDRVQDKPVGATVQHLRVGGVETLLTPIPPLAEQRHIVAKVDQLMALVDQWEAQLAAAHTTADNLLSALVAELTAA